MACFRSWSTCSRLEILKVSRVCWFWSCKRFWIFFLTCSKNSSSSCLSMRLDWSLSSKRTSASSSLMTSSSSWLAWANLPVSSRPATVSIRRAIRFCRAVLRATINRSARSGCVSFSFSAMLMNWPSSWAQRCRTARCRCPNSDFWVSSVSCQGLAIDVVAIAAGQVTTSGRSRTAISGREGNRRVRIQVQRATASIRWVMAVISAGRRQCVAKRGN